MEVKDGRDMKSENNNDMEELKVSVLMTWHYL